MQSLDQADLNNSDFIDSFEEHLDTQRKEASLIIAEDSLVTPMAASVGSYDHSPALEIANENIGLL
jgi:hypothetical protein